MLTKNKTKTELQEFKESFPNIAYDIEADAQGNIVKAQVSNPTAKTWLKNKGLKE